MPTEVMFHDFAASRFSWRVMCVDAGLIVENARRDGAAAARDTAVDGLLDGFEVGYFAEDGMQRRLPLTDEWAVRFEAMAPVRRVLARPGGCLARAPRRPR